MHTGSFESFFEISFHSLSLKVFSLLSRRNDRSYSELEIGEKN